MMHVGSPKLLVISESEQTEISDEEEEVQFKPHVTPHDRLMNALTIMFNYIFNLLKLIGECVGKIRRRGRVSNTDDVPGVAEEEGRSTIQSEGSLDHTPLRPEPEVTSEILQIEMEAGTPLPGEIITTPSVRGETITMVTTPQEAKEDETTRPTSPHASFTSTGSLTT